jgi:NAD(P)-dependent dehydrogenase (short-subunit alcohol dehydrogenase family)
MKTIVITGATSGIGLETAQTLAGAGYRILGVGRSEERCAKAKETILARNGQADVAFFTADLMQQREVLRVADQITAYIKETCGGELHALINNAGCVRSWYMTTEEGYEQQFALNHLAAFLLTHALFPLLRKAGGRVILTGSGSHKHTKVRWDDVMLRRRYNPLFAYKQSKLCGMLFAQGINELAAETGVRAYVADPGLVNTDIGSKGTGGLVNFVWKLRKSAGVSPAVPAKTYAYLCDPANVPRGLYYYQCRERRYSNQVTGTNAARLWRLSEQLCSVQFGKENSQ